LFGTCQGFQLLSVLAAQDQSVLLHYHYDSYNYSIPLVLTSNAASSRLFNGLSSETVKTLTTKNVTQNLHHDGVLPKSYTENANLAKIFNLLSVNTDRKGTPFGSTMEGKELPFYATQWHPERNQFDWGPKEGLNKSPEALHAMQDLANFYVSETRKNFHSFPTPAEEEDNLIFKWSPTYTGNDGVYPEEETYFFPLWTESEGAR
jgi:gamma-glutamyl hydrolase